MRGFVSMYLCMGPNNAHKSGSLSVSQHAVSHFLLFSFIHADKSTDSTHNVESRQS